MRALVAAVLGLSLVVSARAGETEDFLRFAWPERGEALMELTDERIVGDYRRSIVMSMRLHVEPDLASDRLVLRFWDTRLVSVDDEPIASADPTSVTFVVGRVLSHATPTMIVSRDGRYLESRDLDRVTREVLAAAGFPALPPGLDAFAGLVDDAAADDWTAWVGAWLGKRLQAGESTQSQASWKLDDAVVPVQVTRRGLPSGDAPARTRLEASAVYPSAAVRWYTSGFLIDMAREAKELGDDDPLSSRRFLERAVFSPLTETLTIELETASLRPIAAERLRTFSAVARGHRVHGTERRAHRFTWQD